MNWPFMRLLVNGCMVGEFPNHAAWFHNHAACVASEDLCIICIICCIGWAGWQVYITGQCWGSVYNVILWRGACVVMGMSAEVCVSLRPSIFYVRRYLIFSVSGDVTGVWWQECMSQVKMWLLKKLNITQVHVFIYAFILPKMYKGILLYFFYRGEVSGGGGGGYIFQWVGSTVMNSCRYSSRHISRHSSRHSSSTPWNVCSGWSC